MSASTCLPCTTTTGTGSARPTASPSTGYRGAHDDGEHVALVPGKVEGALGVPLAVHVECLASDVFGATTCACGSELDAALATAAAAGRGIVVYARSSEHVRACGLLGDGRSVEDRYAVAAAVAASIVTDLAVGSVELVATPAGLRAALEPVGLRSDDAPRYSVAG
ncbi:hypothetical protein ACL02T_01005 [Pseudonocardia sp. RS010]|uniref:hypothetical protein n=1 Tax=Pseudonocardia sp. RS010 TaxID=3385979 RepID=UPI0039A250D1